MKNKFLKGLVASFALAVSGLANAGLIDVLYTSDASGNADANAILAAQGGTVLEANAALFNSLSLSDLSAYDLLVIGWYGSGSFNLDWETVLLPYIENGGGLIFEAPGEIGDLAGTGFTIVEQNGSNNIASYDNFFGPAIFTNTHMAITSLSSDWTCRMLNTNGNCNLATGEFGAGRAIIGGYDSFYHETGSYDYIVNQANWVTSGVAEVPEPSTLAIFALGLMGLASRKFKKQA
jgi:hypothetical protein